MKMLAPSLPDVQAAVIVESMDRAELIAHIRELERQRSVWEFRIRTCEEKEQLWKNMLVDMGKILSATFEKCHKSITDRAEEAAQLAEQLKKIAQHVEDM
jgi:hypothetical protein